MIVFFLSLRNLHRDETLCLSTFLFMLFVLSAISCAAISIPAASFFNRPVFSQFKIFWLLALSVFTINYECNGFSMKIFLPFSRISFAIFPSRRNLQLLLPLAAFHCCFLHTSLGSLFPFPHNLQHQSFFIYQFFWVCRAYQNHLEDVVLCALSWCIGCSAY